MNKKEMKAWVFFDEKKGEYYCDVNEQPFTAVELLWHGVGVGTFTAAGEPDRTTVRIQSIVDLLEQRSDAKDWGPMIRGMRAVLEQKPMHH